jgi:uncharacterized protein YeaO (DUF488 family)
MQIRLKRAYDPLERADGLRILVDRLWPRGVAKVEAHLDLWPKEVAPSPALRQWFNHDPARWADFQQRYKDELRANPALDALVEAIRGRNVTLVYGAKDREHNHAIVLASVLRAKLR